MKHRLGYMPKLSEIGIIKTRHPLAGAFWEWEGPTTTTESESGIMSSSRTKKSSKIRSTGDMSGKSPGRKTQAARCGFCNLGYEVERTCDTLYVADDVAAHFLCMLYSSGLVQEDGDSSRFEDFGMFDPEDVKKEIKRGLHLSCSVCHKKGATIGCDREECTKTCHYKCGMDHDYVFEENPDEGQFLMYCPRHKDLTSDADDDDENWNSSEEDERDEEQDSDDENTDPSWDASPSKKATPKRQSVRKKGRPPKKRGQKNEGSSPRRSKRARTTVRYREEDEESISDEEGRIPVIRKVSPKKEIKKRAPDEDEEEQDPEKEANVWDHSRKAGTLGAVCSRVKQAMQSALNNIQDDTASEMEYAAVTSFMEITGLMEEIQKEEQGSGEKNNGQTKKEQPEETKIQDVPPKKASRFHSPRKGVKK
ncbi:PHD finger protein 6 [Branchiostoma belcheri]|nr:PHD finger protein 6 [Branchiostoma belcheri]